MSSVEKYENIGKELPKLPEVLLNTIQSDVLEIKRVDKTCKKYISACAKISELANAHYVVYSKYMDKSNHKYEKFIFLGEEGEELFDVCGAEMELYGLLTCSNLSLSEEYQATVSDTE